MLPVAKGHVRSPHGIVRGPPGKLDAKHTSCDKRPRRSSNHGVSCTSRAGFAEAECASTCAHRASSSNHARGIVHLLGQSALVSLGFCLSAFQVVKESLKHWNQGR
jgi:hypothetical protein